MNQLGNNLTVNSSNRYQHKIRCIMNEIIYFIIYIYTQKYSFITPNSVKF